MVKNKSKISKSNSSISKRKDSSKKIWIILSIVFALAIFGVVNIFYLGDHVKEREANYLKTFEGVLETCGSYGQSKMIGAYCKEFREFEYEGVMQYATCNYKLIEDSLGDSKLQGGCDVSSFMSSLSKSFCFDLLNNGEDISSKIVNGKTCVNWFNLGTEKSCTVNRVDGFVYSVEQDACGFGRQDVSAYLSQSSFNSMGEGRVCCIAKLY
jgi:hypothetical protein